MGVIFSIISCHYRWYFLQIDILVLHCLHLVNIGGFQGYKLVVVCWLSRLIWITELHFLAQFLWCWCLLEGSLFKFRTCYISRCLVSHTKTADQRNRCWCSLWESKSRIIFIFTSQPPQKQMWSSQNPLEWPVIVSWLLNGRKCTLIMYREELQTSEQWTLKDSKLFTRHTDANTNSLKA